ncbi:MAG TPA: radical SAM protein [Candidatus Eisenbacteria bacterium]|nr:radical SAM protein [Candidatus Eisenbacteria bacterium]
MAFGRKMPREVDGGGRFLSRRREFTPAYLRSHEEGTLKPKIDEALECLRACTLCPRSCEVDRYQNYAVCKVARYARVSSFFAHFGEEDVLRGWRGSGTIFFGWCNLRCVFCQNYETSQKGEGDEVNPTELAAMMVELQRSGCHNINFVTPEHVVPQILEALPHAIERGLRLPLVYNTSAYDSLHSIELMDGVIDIYMPDFKLWNPEHCRKYLLAPDYPVAARSVIRAMHEQVGPLIVDEEGLATRGVLVRHLVMPGMLEDSREIFRYLAAALSRDTYVNIMDQYFPAWKAAADDKYREIGRRITRSELTEAFGHAAAAGLWRFDTRWRQTFRSLAMAV